MPRRLLTDQLIPVRRSAPPSTSCYHQDARLSSSLPAHSRANVPVSVQADRCQLSRCKWGGVQRRNTPPGGRQQHLLCGRPASKAKGDTATDRGAPAGRVHQGLCGTAVVGGRRQQPKRAERQYQHPAPYERCQRTGCKPNHLTTISAVLSCERQRSRPFHSTAATRAPVAISAGGRACLLDFNSMSAAESAGHRCITARRGV